MDKVSWSRVDFEILRNRFSLSMEFIRFSAATKQIKAWIINQSIDETH
jgi:hypothetical protein